MVSRQFTTRHLGEGHVGRAFAAKQFNRMLATLLVALAAAGAVTYAWYIYNANRHITDVKMAAARA